VHDFADQVAIVSVAQDKRLIGRDAGAIVGIALSGTSSFDGYSW
jgi:hypothetical protein